MRTWLDTISKPDKIYSNPGSPIEPDYKVHYSKSGVRSLEKDGERHTYDEIQSHADSVDINLIYQKYLAGDESVINKRQPLYIDSSDLPQTPGEWFELMQRANDAFLSMPPEERDAYNHSVEQYVQAKVEEGKESTVSES